MFISDYIYWKENNHPMAETLESILMNTMLKIYTVNTNQSTESIIDQAYIIGKL